MLSYWPVAITTVLVCAAFALGGLLVIVFPRRSFKLLAQLGRHGKWPEWKSEVEESITWRNGMRTGFLLPGLLFASLGIIGARLEISRIFMVLNVPPDYLQEAVREANFHLGTFHWLRLVEQFLFLIGGFYVAARPESFAVWSLKRQSDFNPMSPEQELRALKAVVVFRLLGLFFFFAGLLGLRFSMTRIGIVF
ncbi:MAG: hypothetical protein ACRD35_03180 [Candidatus Acidiferrales bacterium]